MKCIVQRSAFPLRKEAGPRVKGRIFVRRSSGVLESNGQIHLLLLKFGCLMTSKSLVANHSSFYG